MDCDYFFMLTKFKKMKLADRSKVNGQILKSSSLIVPSSRDLNRSESDSSLSMSHCGDAQRCSSSPLYSKQSRSNGGSSTDNLLLQKKTFGMEKCASLGEIHSSSLTSANSMRSLNYTSEQDGPSSSLGKGSSRISHITGKKNLLDEDSCSTGEDTEGSSTNRKKHTFTKIFRRPKK